MSRFMAIRRRIANFCAAFGNRMRHLVLAESYVEYPPVHAVLSAPVRTHCMGVPARVGGQTADVVMRCSAGATPQVSRVASTMASVREPGQRPSTLPGRRKEMSRLTQCRVHIRP